MVVPCICVLKCGLHIGRCNYLTAEYFSSRTTHKYELLHRCEYMKTIIKFVGKLCLEFSFDILFSEGRSLSLCQ